MVGPRPEVILLLIVWRLVVERCVELVSRLHSSKFTQLYTTRENRSQSRRTKGTTIATRTATLIRRSRGVEAAERPLRRLRAMRMKTRRRRAAVSRLTTTTTMSTTARRKTSRRKTSRRMRKRRMRMRMTCSSKQRNRSW